VSRRKPNSYSLGRSAGDITATSVAREEVNAYEAGLTVMRAALRAATCTKCQRCVAGKCTNEDALGQRWNPKLFGGDDGTCCLVGYKYCPGQNFCCDPEAACNPAGGCKRG
jgi:hypothetical protein